VLTRKRKQRGSETVAFALVLPIFFLLLFAMIDMGLAINAWNTLSYATRAGARYASVNGSLSVNNTKDLAKPLIIQYVKNQAQGLNLNYLTVDPTWPVSPTLPDGQTIIQYNDPGSTVTVTSTYVYFPLTTYLKFASLTFTSQASATIFH